jgi:phosphotransferase system enzyme I (PtsP)
MGSDTSAAPGILAASEGDEVLAILSSSDSIQGVMDRLVEHLCMRWAASWCSVFLFDETNQRLTLRSGHGAPAALVGKVTFSLGEGLAGRALADRRPIYTVKATQEPGFVALPELPSKDHETLLAVPILRGEERIGVLALQRPTGIPFRPEEISGLRTAASQMAGALESARALLLVETKAKQHDMSPLVITEQRLFRGTSVTKGVAIGVTRVLARTRAANTLEDCRQGIDCPPALRTLDEAVDYTGRQIQHYQTALGQKLPEAATMLFESHLLMLKDDSFIGKIRQHIVDGTPPAQAIALTATEFITFFEASRHDYLREKARDVEDLALRLLDNITCKRLDENPVEEAHIVVTAELLPSDILHVAQGNVQGIVLVGGGSTAHVTLLVRSLHIPMVMTDADELLRIPNGELVIVDCASGNIIVHPNDQIRATYDDRRRVDSELVRRGTLVKDATFTRDRCRIHLLANINLLAELDLATEMKAEGVGLYRTEFPFLMRQALPTEEEQLAVYERLLDQMPDKPITFRTLDAGGDKVLSYFDQAHEENPALGLRSTRFTLRYPYIFDQQLRAILRAIQSRQRNDVKLMFPMIGSVEELQAAIARMDACIAQLRARGGSLPTIRPEVGTMVELPALVHLAHEIAHEASFLSIGTNDFIQYMLAVDRTNSQVASYYVAHHPAVLHGLAHVVRAGRAAEREVSVCGEMGCDPRYVPFFIGIGVRVFSLEPGHLAKVQRLVERISVPEAEAYAHSLLETNRISVIEDAIHRMLARFSPDA